MRLSASVDLPGSGYRVWFERTPNAPERVDYSLAVDEPVSAEASQHTKVMAQEQFKKGALVAVVATDATGRRELVLP